MKQYFFWQNWHSSEKNFYQTLLSFLILSLLFFGYCWFRGIENILHWDVVSELDEVPTILDNFTDGNLKFTVNGNAYIVKEQFLASVMQVNVWANAIFLICYLTSICLLLTSLTTLKRLFFLGGMTIFTALLLSFRLEVLEVFGFTNQTAFLVVFIFYAGISYYFNEFGGGISLQKRFLSYVFLTIILAIIAHFFSKFQHPAMAVSSYGVLAAMVLSVIFVFMISHEIMAGLVWVVGRSVAKGKNALGQFFIISFIYLLNVLLIFLKNTKAIEWNGLIISPFLLFGVSLVLGIWGFRKYCDANNFIDFRSAGAWFYLGLAIITISTITFAFATGNDSLTEVFADAIGYSHLVMGLAFFVHILVNFIQPLQKGLEVYKIIYKPVFSPLSIARIFAISAIVALLAMKHYFPIYQTLAGSSNAIADAYLVDNQPLAAEVYYKKAIRYDFQNHHANYAMASLAMQNKDEINAEYFFKQALLKNPSEYAFAGRTQALLQEDRYFEALFNLKDGIKQFPKSAELLTNLAYLHAKAKGGSDSTLYYLNLAKKYCSNCDVAETNLLAFWAKNGDYQKLDSIVSSSQSTSYESFLANKRAVENKTGKASKNDFSLKIKSDSTLNVSQFAMIYNLSVNAKKQTLTNEKLIQKRQQKAGNTNFYEDLEFAKACQNYYRENKIEGIKSLAILANDSTSKKNLYARTVGMWFLQQGVFDKAKEYLAKSGDKSSVEVLEKQNYAETVKNLQKAQAEKALKNAKTQANFDAAIQENPLNPLIIKQVAVFYNDKLKKPNEAYKMIFDALALNDYSAELWKTYALQSLSMGLRDYAEEGLQKVRTLATAADYQAFLSIYQAKKSLMEKSNEGFK